MVDPRYKLTFDLCNYEIRGGYSSRETTYRLLYRVDDDNPKGSVVAHILIQDPYNVLGLKDAGVPLDVIKWFIEESEREDFGQPDPRNGPDFWEVIDADS